MNIISINSFMIQTCKCVEVETFVLVPHSLNNINVQLLERTQTNHVRGALLRGFGSGLIGLITC